MRDNDLHRQRLQQRMERLAPAGLEKGGLFVLRKTGGFALIKAGGFALKKTVFSPSKRQFCRFEKSGFVALKKADFFVLRTVGCVLRGAKATTRIGGSPM